MATTESNSFEIERRVVIFKSTTTLPDGSSLGYEGDPNVAINGNTDGETLIYSCPMNTRYSESDGSEWAKESTPNTWIKLSDVTVSGSNHSELGNLDYVNSGHTGFASSSDTIKWAIIFGGM